MRSRQLTAIVSGVAGLAVAGIFAGPALAAPLLTATVGTGTQPLVSATVGGSGTQPLVSATIGGGTGTGTGGGTGTQPLVSATIGLPVAAPTATPTCGCGDVKPGALNLTGLVTAINKNIPSITLSTAGANGGTTSRTISVPKTAAVTVNGVKSLLGSIPTGAEVTVGGTTSSSGASTANLITARTSWPVSLKGTVSAVNASAGTVTLKGASLLQGLVSGLLGGASPTGTQVLNVGANVPVSLNGTSVALKALPIGANLNITGTQTTAGLKVGGIQADLGLGLKLPTPAATTTKPCVKPTVAPTATVPAPVESIEPGGEDTPVQAAAKN